MKTATMLSCSIIAAVVVSGCAQPESQFVRSSYREWITTTPDGGEESILIEPESITWSRGTEEECSCPYRVYSFHEERREMEINTLCKRRTGSELPVSYNLHFREDGDAFELRLEGRTVAVYRAK